MGRFKIQKKQIFIDMTPMSDVMVLLLTFFMLTSTFIKKEPVKVNTPGSVSEIKVPDKNVLTIIIEKTGRVFMEFDRKVDQEATLSFLCDKYSLHLSGKQIKEFSNLSAFGISFEKLPALMNLPENEREAWMGSKANEGIPCDSVRNQFKDWILSAKEANPDLRISIKADATTSYKVIKQVMTSLQDIKENRYNLITNLKKEKLEE